MREVSLRGPNDVNTWMRLISRADMICASFSAKQSALVFNSFSRVMDVPDLIGSFDAFVKRYVRKFLVKVIPTCSPLDSAQLVHAMGEFHKCLNGTEQNVIATVMESLREKIPLMQDRELSMTACGLIKLRNRDPLIATLVLESGLRLGGELSDQSLAQIVNLAANCQPGSGSNLCDLVNRMIIQTPSRTRDMNPRTMALLLTSLVKLRVSNPEFVSSLSDSILSPSNSRLTSSSFQTLAVILRSLQKMGIGERNPLVLHKLVDLMNSRSFGDQTTGDLCMYVNGVARMKGYDEDVMTCLRLILARELTPVQVILVLQSFSRLKDPLGCDYLAGMIMDHLKLHSESFSKDQLNAIAVAVDSSPLGEFHIARELFSSRA